MDSNSNRYLTDIHGYSRIFDGYPTDIENIWYSDIRISNWWADSNIRISRFCERV